MERVQLNGEGFEMTEKKKENMFGSWFVSLFGGEEEEEVT